MPIDGLTLFYGAVFLAGLLAIEGIYFFFFRARSSGNLEVNRRADFAGMLSALYAGEKVVALHMGMRSRCTWHYWFPCYDRDFARYSPGHVLLLEMTRSAEALGIASIDLGPGVGTYKERFSTASKTVAGGVIEVSRPVL